jgi:hypothetical protein
MTTSLTTKQVEELLTRDDGTALIERLAEFMDEHCIDINVFASMVKQDKNLVQLVRLEAEKNKILKKTFDDCFLLDDIF